MAGVEASIRRTVTARGPKGLIPEEVSYRLLRAVILSGVARLRLSRGLCAARLVGLPGRRLVEHGRSVVEGPLLD
jgi:hypothetical protein